MRQAATFGKKQVFIPTARTSAARPQTSAARSAAPNVQVSDQAVAQFIGPNIHKFIPVMQAMRAKDPSYRKGVISWCWPAFWLGPIWMLYRKMWVAAAAFFILNVVLAYLFKNSSGLMFNIIMGMLGKPLYVGHAARKVEEIEANATNPIERINDMSRMGGVSPGAVWAAFGVIVLIGIGMGLLAMAAAKSGQIPMTRGA